MSFVTSADGTNIAYDRTGDGPPLVLVHGCAVSRVIWDACTERLSDHFTVYRFDRRGRGESGDGATYSLAREADDVLAIIDEIGEPVSLFGHSYGANVAFESAKRSDQVSNLVLYEPRLPVAPHDAEPDFAPTLWSYVRDGKERTAKRVFFTEMVGSVPFDTEEFPETVEQTPARTLAREIEAAERSQLTSRPGISARTLLLDAEESSDYFRDATRAISNTLAESERTFLPGVGHETITDDIVIDSVIEFLTRSTAHQACSRAHGLPP